jgi:arginase family enzyme
MDAPIPFAGCFSDEADPTLPLVFVGLPCDVQSAFCRGSAEGPSRIRLGYDGRAYNSTTELGVDVAGLVADLGDWEPAETWEETRQRYREEAEALFAGGPVPFFAGGDHAVTMPLVEALAILDEPVHVVQLDAHPDLYPEYDGDRWSHACVAARILDCESDVSHIPEGAPVYLTVDLDAFDPAFAPGVSHPVPGGLTPRQALGIVQDAPWRLVGMDVVEVSPRLDVRDRTAVLAARLLHEAMGRVVEPDD